MRKVCSSYECKKLRHIKSSEHCFECGNKLIQKPFQWKFKSWYTLIVIVLFVFFGAGVGISKYLDYSEVQQIETNKQIELLPEKWLDIYYLLNGISVESDRAEVLEYIVTNDLPNISSENIYFLMSFFHYDSNKNKVILKLRKFRENANNTSQ